MKASGYKAKALVAVSLFVVLSVACSSAAATATPTPVPPTATPIPIPTPFTIDDIDIEDVVITLERTACLGECPVYSLTISGDGVVEYKGEYAVAVEGRQITRITQEQVRQLVEAFFQVGFFSFRGSYDCIVTEVRSDGTELCVSMTDGSSTFTSIAFSGTRKRVRNYLGAPDALIELENLIEETVNSKRWIEGPTPTARPSP